MTIYHIHPILFKENNIKPTPVEYMNYGISL